MKTTRLKYLLLGLVAVGLAFSQPLAAADVANANVSFSASVAAAAKLTLSGNSLTFPDSDPDSVEQIAATEGAITITAKGKTSAGGNITLTLLASGDLTGGGNTIPVSNITWTADGDGFVAGTMSKDAAQSVGSWTNSGNRQGSVSFRLANSWDYKTGNYSVSATYTLTAP